MKTQHELRIQIPLSITWLEAEDSHCSMGNLGRLGPVDAEATGALHHQLRSGDVRSISMRTPRGC